MGKYKKRTTGKTSKKKKKSSSASTIAKTVVDAVPKKLFVIIISLMIVLTTISIAVILIINSVRTVVIPEGLRKTQNAIVWNAVENVSGYIVDLNGQISKVTTASFDITKLSPNHYEIKVSAVDKTNTEKTSKFSDTLHFVIEKQQLSIKSIDNINLSKTYDGDAFCDEQIKLGIHYAFDSPLELGDNVDIVIIDATFNSPDVLGASYVSVGFEAVLTGTDADKYSIVAGSFQINASIKPKTLEVVPNNITKQSLDTDYLEHSFYDENLSKFVPVTYMRTFGEDVGFYDIIGAVSQDTNYSVKIKADTGKLKFEITERYVNIHPFEMRVLSKTFDNNANYTSISEILKGREYYIENVVDGYEVDIAILSATYNSKNAADADRVIVTFSFELIDDNGIYKTLCSSFELQGVIVPKKIDIAFGGYTKEYGNTENLNRVYEDPTLGFFISYAFVRELGEDVGTYDILSILSFDLNYTFSLIDNTGHGRFVIDKRLLCVTPTDVQIEKVFDGTLSVGTTLQKNLHYTIGNMLDGDNIDIIIISSYYNFYTVSDATFVIVQYDAVLTAKNNTYRLSGGSFELSATIHRKQITLEKNDLTSVSFEKNYADKDALKHAHYDTETKSIINLSFMRSDGETVGSYSILSYTCDNNNYAFTVTGVPANFVIHKRILSVALESFSLTKTYDDTIYCGDRITNGKHYRINNIVINEESDIQFTLSYNRSDVTASHVSLELIGLTQYFDRYELVIETFQIPATITPKRIDIVPNVFAKQFGDIEFDLTQQFNDASLNKTIALKFSRAEGESIGSYDINGLVCDNSNYAFSIISNTGNNKFTIKKRQLVIKPTLQQIEKTYDGNATVIGGISKGLHYTIEGELANYATDIVLLSAYYDVATVNAICVTAQYSLTLSANNDIYDVMGGSFIISASINKKTISISLPHYGKEYGDFDNLSASYYDDVIGIFIGLTYIRTLGETVRSYDIVSVSADNVNYDFTVENGYEKFTIRKRKISVSATDVVLTKIFDNSTACADNISFGRHYTIANMIKGKETDIHFTNVFNSKDVNATAVIVLVSGIVSHSDKYELTESTFLISATITKKLASIVPNYFTKQYGDVDAIWQQYSDSELGLTFNVVFGRDVGENTGTYDIISATAENTNYIFTVLSGIEKFVISPRILGVEKIGNPVFAKDYDGNKSCAVPILQGFHYNLTNLNEGSNVSLSILSQEYDSANVLEATKVIVRYSALVQGNDLNFVTTAGTITFDAQINPRAISVTPNLFEKKYSESISLSQTVFDGFSGEYIIANFVSTAGLNHDMTDVGNYDITEVSCNSTNHAFSLVEQSGLDKYAITKNSIAILASDKDTVYNGFAQSIETPYSIPSKTLVLTYKLFATSDFIVTTPINAGMYTVRVSFVGDNNYNDEYIDVSLFIDRATAIITNETPNNYIYDGSIKPIVASLNHAETTMTFSRNDFVNAGTYNDVIISVAQTTNYKTASIKVSLTIAVSVIYNSDITYPTASSLVYGQYLYSSILSGGTNMGVYEWTNGAIIPLASDTQFAVNFTPYDIHNYDWTDVDMSRIVTIVVEKATTIITNNTPNNYIYDGNIKPIIALLNHNEVVISISQNNFINAGTYTDIILSVPESANYTAASVAITLIIAQRIILSSEIVFPTAMGLVYGAHLNSSTLSGGTVNMGSFAWANGNVLPVVSDTQFQVIFTPFDTANYNWSNVSMTHFVSINIERATATITNLTPSNYVYDGTIKPIVASLSHSETSLLFSRNDYINAGTYNYILISATQTTNYKATSITIILTIARKVINNNEISFPTAASVIYGQYLYGSVLSGGSEMGTFAWANGKVIPTVANTHFSVIFTPNDTINYDWNNVDMSRMVAITVQKLAITSLVFPEASPIISGQALSSSALIGTSLYGFFSWQNSKVVPTVSGNTYNVVFTPYDTLNYDFSEITTIREISIVVTFPIKFATNGAEPLNDLLVRELNASPFIAREGYVFLGWYLDDNFTQAVIYPYAVTKAVTFYALWRSAALTFTLNNNGTAYIVSANNAESSTRIIIPAQYRGLPITTIANEAFMNNQNIKYVFIPNTVTTIGARAFFNAINLEEIEIDNSQGAINFGEDWSKTNVNTDIYYLIW
ncbi:MAG: leucine-rich repeat protein [Christensenellaceae bacterium]|jgi:uncharacterized repeat protein (TIGR02543 family)|nr:leucine-rich repeat protein [Christensenellaceae bacterium]